MKIKIKTPILLGAHLAMWLAVSGPLFAAEQMTRLDASSGSKMRLEGTSAIHDYAVQASFIGGFLEVGANFPLEPGQAVSPGKVEAHGQAWVTVMALRSTEGHDRMDDKMHEMLQQTNYPRIVYLLDSLVLKEAPKDKNGPYLFDSTGKLEVAGVTNKLSMPVSILPLGDKKLKITGSAPLKMTDFGIQPASIVFVKTADEVTIKFDWMVAQKKPASAGASK
ncbi:MAG: hypothetical protein QOJ40_2495 [Verrucomicrobiota bacterium]